MRDSRKDGEGQTQPLSTLWARRAEYSGHASTHVRTSALAGLAVVWLFAGGSDGQLAGLAAAPTSLLIAAATFAASLAADILQYYVGAELFRRLARDQEMHHNKSHDDPVQVQPWIPGVPAAFYNIKVLLLFAGYTMLIAAFIGALFAAYSRCRIPIAPKQDASVPGDYLPACGRCQAIASLAQATSACCTS